MKMTDEIKTTAPWGSLQFSMAEHISCMSNQRHLEYFQRGADALPEACRVGHARIDQPRIVDPRNK